MHFAQSDAFALRTEKLVAAFNYKLANKLPSFNIMPM
jgi:hypothetical protein